MTCPRVGRKGIPGGGAALFSQLDVEPLRAALRQTEEGHSSPLREGALAVHIWMPREASFSLLEFPLPLDLGRLAWSQLPMGAPECERSFRVIAHLEDEGCSARVECVTGQPLAPGDTPYAAPLN